jgi:hypothetical protein
MKLSAHLQYLRYVARHKFYVARECFRFGLYWRGIKHDWTKFLPCEWTPYVASFYGPWDYSDRPKFVVDLFNRAWLHHQHHNSHHWQHWVLREDSGATIALEMPVDDVFEMFCDWIGAGLAITGKREVWVWYAANSENIILHPATRDLIEGLIADECFAQEGRK